MKNIFWFGYINSIGGIETFFYNIAKKYNDLDITIYYGSGDSNQIKRLKKYVRCVKYNGEQIKCDNAFFKYNTDIIDKVEAKEYIQILHADYVAVKLKPNTHKKITKYLAVSEIAKKSFEKATGLKAEVCYNPIEIEPPKKVLNLISATRLTEEKGKGRMIQLANELDMNNIPYQWLIFTDDKNAINNPNIVYMKPRLDITNFIANADYLIQLSDAEGYCYSVVESLMVKTPVIVTNMPVMKELGINKTNAYILDFDLSNLDVNKIYNNIPKVSFNPPESNWGNILAKGKSTYKEELDKLLVVRATDKYKKYNLIDQDLGIVPNQGYEFTIDEKRFKTLNGENKYKEKFVELIGTCKELKKLR